MATKISNLMIMMVMGISVYMGMMTFMAEMNLSYDMFESDNSTEDLEDIFESINASTINIQSELTGDRSWLETAFTVVFALPQTVMSSLSVMATSGTKLLSVATGEDMTDVTIPWWVINMVTIVIGVIIITTVVYLVMGRGM